MAEITPLSFYNPYQPTTGDLNQLLPDWFFNSTPMTANQAITANAQATSAQAQATSAQAQAEANSQALSAQNQVREALAQDNITSEDDLESVLAKSATIYGKTGQIDEMTKALNTLIAKRKADRPEIKGSVSSGIYQTNPDGSIVVLAPPQRSRTPQYTTVYGPNGQPQMVPKDPNVVNPMYQQGYTSEAPIYLPNTNSAPAPTPSKRIVRGTVKRQ